MLLANWLDVPDAMAFLDAFAEAAEKTRGWRLEGNKLDCGCQTVVARYVGRKFEGDGQMVVAFSPINTPNKVNITLRAKEWPSHVCFEEAVKNLVSPILIKTRKNLQPVLRIAK